MTGSFCAPRDCQPRRPVVAMYSSSNPPTRNIQVATLQCAARCRSSGDKSSRSNWQEVSWRSAANAAGTREWERPLALDPASRFPDGCPSGPEGAETPPNPMSWWGLLILQKEDRPCTAFSGTSAMSSTSRRLPAPRALPPRWRPGSRSHWGWTDRSLSRRRGWIHQPRPGNQGWVRRNKNQEPRGIPWTGSHRHSPEWPMGRWPTRPVKCCALTQIEAAQVLPPPRHVLVVRMPWDAFSRPGQMSLHR